ncbi:hypothetical protein PPTG_21356 [Phytophthora nicotianae INRA-310]|uniref:Uncharacterized protein n=3 Tax=Phytophthora nicotianae TaxID=4792 RepID=W2R7P2_PHYN3|nr:hypothetical protein PPTG_21356 [Phytophthora nicotianae INRA-310]ETN20724.1 hypothetical protein PPTG_21356 [Phytophthora nicotianae INRA-310]
MNVPNLGIIAGNMQAHHFRKWLDFPFNPKRIASLLVGSIPTSDMRLPETDLRYKTWEDYYTFTTQSKTYDEFVLKRVKTYFGNGSRYDTVVILV